MIGKHDVRLDIADDIELTVIADKEEVRVFKHARFFCRLDYLKEPSFGIDNALCDLLGKESGLVAVAVDVAGVEHEKVGLMLFYDIADAAHDELVGRGMRADLHIFKIRCAALVIKLLARARAQESRLFGVVG